MAVHQAVLHPAWDFRDVDEEWVAFAGDCIPLAEVSAMRKEVELVIESLGPRRCSVLSDLVSEDINTCVQELHNVSSYFFREIPDPHRRDRLRASKLRMKFGKQRNSIYWRRSYSTLAS